MNRRFLAGPLPLRLTIDAGAQRVGQRAVYRISGAPPGQPIWWTSFKDGQPTGENRVPYDGQVIESNGTAEITAEPWRVDDVGRWTKQIEVPADNGQTYLGIVEFVVTPELSATPNASLPASNAGSFFETPLFSLGGFEVTPGVLLAVAVAGYFLSGFKGRR